MEDTDFENLPPGFMVKEMSLAEYEKLTEKATTGVLEIKQISAPLCPRAKRARYKKSFTQRRKGAKEKKLQK